MSFYTSNQGNAAKAKSFRAPTTHKQYNTAGRFRALFEPSRRVAWSSMSYTCSTQRELHLREVRYPAAPE